MASSFTSTIDCTALSVSPTTLTTLAETLYDARQTAVESGLEIDEEDADPLCAEEQAVRTTLEEDHSLTHCGTGAARSVFALNEDYVVKFPRYGETSLTDGLEQNHRERRLSEEVGDRYRLLPVVATHTSDWWVLMPHITPLSDSPELDEDAADLSALNDLLESLLPLAEYIHTPEINPQNVAYYNGSLHLFDYGRPPVALEDV